MPLWLCTVDFRKAFDSIEHVALWRALAEQGVHAHYIKTLASLYTAQVGHINVGVLSREFSITRGVKQGDPISP
eukprot:5019251-Karenia_brevis.AAC.1